MSGELQSQVATEAPEKKVKGKSNANHVLMRIKTRFLDQINTKTSWGKNEVKSLYDDISTEELCKELFANNKELAESD